VAFAGACCTASFVSVGCHFFQVVCSFARSVLQMHFILLVVRCIWNTQDRSIASMACLPNHPLWLHPNMVFGQIARSAPAAFQAAGSSRNLYESFAPASRAFQTRPED
jgi:hypothetical protein